MNSSLILTLILLLPSWTEPTPLVILRTNRSGSSWFTSLFNRHKGVYITDEIVIEDDWDLRKQVERLGEGMTYYIAESVRRPMWAWPRGEDVTAGNETSLIVGSNFDPWHVAAKLDKVVELVPNLRVVAYFRTNVVKHVISFIRGKELLRQCKEVVVKSWCKLRMKVTVVLKEFDNWLILVIAHDLYMWKTAKSLAANLKGKLRVVRYEDLLGHENENEFERLLMWLGFDINDLGYKDEFGGKCTLNCTKNTSDDLRDSIANYEKVESWINSRYPCLNSQFHETTPGKVQPSILDACGDLFKSKVDSYLKRYTIKTENVYPTSYSGVQFVLN